MVPADSGMITPVWGKRRLPFRDSMVTIFSMYTIATRRIGLTCLLLSLAGLIACKKEWITKTAATPVAYESDAAPIAFLVGKGVTPDSGSVPRLQGMPANRYFDPSGYEKNIVNVNGDQMFSEDQKSKLASSLSLAYTQACSAALGVSSESAHIANAHIVATRTFGIDSADRRYTNRLKACCAGAPGCSSWIVNRAYKTKVTWSLKSDSQIGLQGNVQCGTLPSALTAGAPDAGSGDGGAIDQMSGAIDGGPGGAPTTLATLATAATTTTDLGLAASVTYDSTDHKSATLTSEGWNVVEILPLDLICQDQKTDCTGATGAVRKQLMCD